MLDDARNQLVKEFVRLVAELDASAFVFENVKGLTIGKHRLFLENLIAEFEAAGYSVQLPWRVLNAKHYGVPQDRQRLFIMGAKKGRQLPSYPDPIVQTEAGLFEKGKRPLTTCYDALCDLPDAESYDELLFSDSAICAEWGNASWYSKEMRCLNKTSWHNGYVRKWDPDFLTSSMRTYHTEASRKRFASTGEGEIEPISRFFKLARKGVCNTLRAGTDSARGAFTSPRPIHYTHARCITVREMARLHGYPDWFRFHATKWHGARQIGNSVPPPLGRFVAGQIIAALGMKPTRPNAKVPLGDTSLLSMDMSEAAAFWGVPIIIGKRDRKAGLTSKKATAENTDPLETRKVS
jgi:DNA (cytosine-5)-methyltransferase 1